MDTRMYLERIKYKGALQPTLDTLRGLQLSHLLAVPFENLSIHAHEPIYLQEEYLYDKIVLRHRGGFCYELNGLFAILLRDLGFRVTMLSAGVANRDGGFGPEYDHMALMVSLEERWLVDVGFGDTFQQPLRVDQRGDQAQGERNYRIEESGGILLLQQKDPDSDWKPQYRFTLRPCELADYAEMCHFHQTSPASIFTRRRICSIATGNGRVTLSDLQLIETQGQEKRERALDEGEYAAVLAKEFGIELGGG